VNWSGADKDRGYGPRLPRWDAMDSQGCPSSGSMVVTDRTAFSPPIPVGPPGTKYFFGFAAKLTRPTSGPYCEIHWCSDESCVYFVTLVFLAPTAGSSEWQNVVSGVAAEVPMAAMTTPFAQIACFGYGEPNGPDVHFDRFYFSTQPGAF
jgi:hypothetical protein